MRRKICVVTGSRAEYGILKPLLDSIVKDNRLRLQIVAIGMHMSKEFGLTYKEIESDGFRIDRKVHTLVHSDTHAGISSSMARSLEASAQAFESLCPDVVILLGDRFDIFSAATSAYIAGIPIAHIHGGEVTEAVIDEAFRHSITKMSYIHFVSTDVYRRRVIQLGESPDRVFNVGALGVDNIKRSRLISRDEIERSINCGLGERNILATFHPATLEAETPRAQFKKVLSALGEMRDVKLFFTKTSADSGGRSINRMIDRFVASRMDMAVSFKSLGRLRYLSLMSYMDGVIGNSSSGIIEAPSLRVGTVNIGDRQKGRVRASSVIDCEVSQESIGGALKKLYSSSFQRSLSSVRNPYGNGGAADRIKKVLAGFVFPKEIKKAFYDIKVGRD